MYIFQMAQSWQWKWELRNIQKLDSAYHAWDVIKNCVNNFFVIFCFSDFVGLERSNGGTASEGRW